MEAPRTNLTVDAMDKITELKNYIHQKYLKIAKRARIKEEDGKSTEHEFCCLMRLQALLISISDIPVHTVDQLREIEILANNICGREKFMYKPVDWSSLNYDVTEDSPAKPISACDITYENADLITDAPTLCKYIDRIIDTLTYEKPWIAFNVKSGLAPGKHEVGQADSFTNVGVTVNKESKDFYDIDKNGELVQYARELKNAIPDQLLTINFQNAIPQKFLLHGEYFDLEKYLSTNLKAEADLEWESVWPFYYGIGPLTALDTNPNAFIQSLTRVFQVDKEYEIDITEGNVLYFFFPFEGVKKEFVTENGVLRGSYKGELTGVRTLSMDNNNVAGTKTYGVIRTDNEGIRYLKFKVEDMLIDSEITMPESPTDTIVNEYAGHWHDTECVKQ